MDYLEYVTKRIALFHCELHTSFGHFIKAATCMAVGIILGWIMTLLALFIYKMALVLGAKPTALPNAEDAEIDMDLDMSREQIHRDAWLERFWEAQQQEEQREQQQEQQQHLQRELPAL